MEIPKPTDAHQKLEILVGSWTGDERMSPSPWDPEGGAAVGRVENRLALDGFVVVQDYVQERGNVVTYRGHGIFSWDAARESYALHWYDSMGSPPTEFRGDFHGDTLTLLAHTTQGHQRATFEFGKEGRYVFKGEVSQDGTNWHTFMEGTYDSNG